MGLDWIGLSYTAVTPRASLQSDANNNDLFPKVVLYHKLQEQEECIKLVP